MIYNFDKILTDEVRVLGTPLIEAGYSFRPVGGCVRDALVGMTPKDIDIATNALPDTVMSLYRDAGFTVIPTGLSHGTVTVVHNHIPYEITTYRIDLNTDGRHAKVEFTDDWKADAARRDFTFNAMSIDMNGKLYDAFGGVKDLNAGIVRFIGNPLERIQEDYLRILRYFRFSARVNNSSCRDGSIGSFWGGDYSSYQTAMCNLTELSHISVERIWSELKKIAQYDSAMTVFSELTPVFRMFGGGDVVIADDPRNIKVSALGKFALFMQGDNLHEFLNRMKASNAEIHYITSVQKQANIEVDNEEIFLHSLRISEPDDLLTDIMVMRNVHVDMQCDVLAWMPSSQKITGSDLLKVGVSTGPDMGKALKASYTAWINSDFSLSKERQVEVALGATK